MRRAVQCRVIDEDSDTCCGKISKVWVGFQHREASRCIDWLHAFLFSITLHTTAPAAASLSSFLPFLALNFSINCSILQSFRLFIHWSSIFYFFLRQWEFRLFIGLRQGLSILLPSKINQQLWRTIKVIAGRSFGYWET